MMKFRVAEQFRGLSAVEFTREFLDLFDTTQLSEFKFRKSQVSGGRYKGIHGNCKPPGYPNWNATTFRISCSVSGTDEDFPKRKFFPWESPSKHAGTVRPEYVAESVNELLAWVAGHELFHYLGQPRYPHAKGYPGCTAQVPGDYRSEPLADKAGYEFLYAIRESREPVEVAAALLTGDEAFVALSRYPYTRA